MASKRKGDWVAPSAVLLSARLATGAGKHGGTTRQKNKRDRSAARRELRG